MSGHQADVAEQGARRASCGRSTRPQRHLLGAAIPRIMARFAGLLWPMHHLLQPGKCAVAVAKLDRLSRDVHFISGRRN
jgi:hypothetical protein